MSIERNELEEAAERAAKGIVDPEAAKRARVRRDAIREVIRKRVGIVDVVVPDLRAHREA